MRTLRRRNKGPDVGQLQRALNRAAGQADRDCLGMPYHRGRELELDDDFGGITEQALIAFQTVQQRSASDFGVDGICGSQTRSALGITGPPGAVTNHGPASETPTEQRTHGPQGRAPGTKKLPDGKAPPAPPPAGESMPVWMSRAWAEFAMDVHEIRGVPANKHVLKYLGVGHVSRDTVAERAAAGKGLEKRLMKRKDADKFADVRVNELDEVPWCAAFVGWCLKQDGFTRQNAKNPGRWHGNFLGAKSWRPESGKGTPRYGAVTVVEHLDGGFHVGFYVGTEGSKVRLLGGNQKDIVHGSGGAVNVRGYSYSSVWFLWPYDVWPHLTYAL